MLVRPEEGFRKPESEFVYSGVEFAVDAHKSNVIFELFLMMTYLLRNQSGEISAEIIHSLTRAGRKREDTERGVESVHIARERIEIEIGQTVGLGHHQRPAYREHQRVFYRLVIPFRNAQEHRGKVCTQIELRGADQITYILDDDDIQFVQGEFLQCLHDHRNVQMAVPAGTELAGPDGLM